MKVVDIANEIYSELGSPSELSIPPIAFWVRNNVGLLNNQLNQSFYIDGDLEIKRDVDDFPTDMSEDEKVIFKRMYLVHFYGVKIMGSLGAASTDTIVEISDGGTSVRRINKTEQSRIYQMAKTSEENELNKLINAYKLGKAEPSQVAGDDTVEGSYSSRSVVRSKTNPNL